MVGNAIVALLLISLAPIFIPSQRASLPKFMVSSLAFEQDAFPTWQMFALRIYGLVATVGTTQLRSQSTVSCLVRIRHDICLGLFVEVCQYRILSGFFLR